MSPLRRLTTAALVALILTSLAVPNAHAVTVTIDWVTVGNPGNANDPATGSVYGAVPYEYQIGKYEVTIQQYTDFLNAVAKSDPYSLYSTSMLMNRNSAGISRSGTSGDYTYHVIDNAGLSGNRPITFVSWFDAARFANWMHNGQGSGSTEMGAYTLGGAMSGDAVAVNTGARVYIPTENEWYKAAYYAPLLNSGLGGYYKYATQSDTVPGNIIGSGSNQANYFNGVHSVTQLASYSPSQNYLTDVGAFTNSTSFYGTFDQNGNVFEWKDDTGAAGPSRGIRGGGWHIGSQEFLESPYRNVFEPSFESGYVGFRLASPVPEPSTYAMALAGVACGGFSMCRRRKRA